MYRLLAVPLVLPATAFALTGPLQPGGVQLLCHRTANEDMPENTLESLEQAALLGCNVVEIDLRRSLDGQIVLNHDGILERLTDGSGEVETTYYGDLQLRDAGLWMGDRFAGMRMALFEDALRLARRLDIRLVLDIKTKGIGVDVLETLQQEGMLERVQFNGEWSDIKRLYPAAIDAGFETVWVQPGVTTEQVKEHHLKGEAVVANFSANRHAMDLEAMKAAVAAGVDAINVDYPRLGADAVGRPVERRLSELVQKANAGDSATRTEAILALSRYRGFPLQDDFIHWLSDPDDNVSRAAALALVAARPRTPVEVFASALRSENVDVRKNAAWALGELNAPTSVLLPLLQDKDAQVLQSALLALQHAPGEASAQALLPLLSHPDAAVRGAAALALARHQPQVASIEIPRQLKIEMESLRAIDFGRAEHAPQSFTPTEVAQITGAFRCQMKMIQAIAMVKGDAATRALEEQAFRQGKDFSQMNGVVAAFDLWDRIGSEPAPAIEALGAQDTDVADRAEWMLVQAGAEVLPEVRKAIGSENPAIRERAIRVVAWQGDIGSLDLLRRLEKSDPADAGLTRWAVAKIESLHPSNQSRLNSN